MKAEFHNLIFWAGVLSTNIRNAGKDAPLGCRAGLHILENAIHVAKLALDKSEAEK